MKRILWIGPLLTLFFYAPVGMGGEPELDNPHRDAGYQADSQGDHSEVVLASGCSSCSQCGEVRCETSSCTPKRKRCHRFFGGMEYLNWWSKGQDLPPLVAAGDGLPPNPILFGADKVGDDYQAGGRATVGFWMDDCKELALVVRGYGAEGSDVRYAAESDGTPAFAIPFINDGSIPALAGLPDSFLLADVGLLQPGVPAGVQAEASNEIFGGDAFFRKLYRQGCGYRVDWLAGYQYSRIDDNVLLQTSTSRVGGPTLETFDQFDAANHFNAGELGMIIQWSRGSLTIELLSKIGLGNMDQQISIQGANSVDGTVTGGGIFAQNQSAAGGPNFNIGDFERNEFAYSPEIGIKSIWCLRKSLNMTVGYTFIYWSDVLLAGNSIDTRVNRDVLFDGPFIPGGGSNPSFRFNNTDYWAHTLDLGLSYRY